MTLGPSHPGTVLMVLDAVEGGLGAAVLMGARWLERRGWRVVIAGPHRGDWNGFPVHQVPIPLTIRDLRGDRDSRRAIRRIVKAIRPDIVHCHGLRSFWLTRVASSVPAFVTLHGTGSTIRDPRGFGMLRTAALGVVPRIALAAFSAGPEMGGRWRFTPHASPRLAEGGVLPPPPVEGVPVFLWIGRLDVPKRPHQFVEAIALAAEATPVRGAMLGSGPLEGSVRQLAERRRAPVDFLGEREDVFGEVREARAAVLFTNFEAVSFAVQEAMWAGRPVVVTHLPGIRWLAGDDAWYADDAASAAEAFVRLADYRTAIESGRAAAERIRSVMDADSPWPFIETAYQSALSVRRS